MAFGVIIGAAGHVDHGKSTLLEALTGRPMDRPGEERRRGITIDLHFAPLDVGGPVIIGVVDVPGHEDLVRTMVAGAAGIDMVLLVVAADEGIMPQTREHLAVVEHLGIASGIPVITKTDLVEADVAELVALEVADWLRASAVRFSPPVLTSVTTGNGLPALRDRLRQVSMNLPTRDAADLFRMPIDRALSVPGAGTVVTGTTWSGRIGVGDSARVLPMGRDVRVRSLQSHGLSQDRSEPGTRTAVAISGIDRAEIRRGDVLVASGDRWTATSALDVELSLLPDTPRPLSHRTRVRLHLGTAEVLARIQVKQPVEPGARGWARLVLESPVVARGGDRFVIRSYSPVATIGGGWVIDPLPPKGARWPEGLTARDGSVRLRALVERRMAGIERDEVPVVLGANSLPPETLREAAGLLEANGWWFSRIQLNAAKDALRAEVLRHQAASPLEPGLKLETLRATLKFAPWIVQAALAELVASGSLVQAAGLARTPDFQPQMIAGDIVFRRLMERIEGAGLTPPSLNELETEFERLDIADFLRLAAREGRLRAVERDRYYGTAALDQFRHAVREIGARGEITPAALRERLGLSRKYLIPLLEWSDAEHLTVRRGDVRRLAAPLG